jgi:hypothetical protein
MIFLIIIILYLVYIESNFGIRNYLIKFNVNYYYTLDGIFNKEQFIETLKSYNFNVEDKTDNLIIVNYKSNYRIIKFKIYNYDNYYKIYVSFNHIFFDMQSVTNIINNYLKNNIKQKQMITYKHFYKNDLLLLNLIYTGLSNYNKKYNYKKIILDNNYIQKIKNESSVYISKIDIIISFITKMYLTDYKKEKCNIIIVKADKNKQADYIGNPVTFHLAQVNNKQNIAYQIRNSYKNNKFLLMEKIDIYITSWVPVENYKNKIKEIDINNPNTNTITDFFVVLCMINNDYIINLYYL